MLDELLASGEVTWSGAGTIGGGDGWIAFHPADSAPLTLAPPTEIEFTDAHRAIMDILGGGGAYFFRQLAGGERSRDSSNRQLWELIWAGWVTGDTFAPVRAMLAGTGRRSGRPAHRQRSRPPRLSRYSVAHAQTRASDPTVAGRWSALPAAEPDSTVRAHFQAELLLNRHGVLTKGAVASEGVPGGFAMLYKVLTAFEDAGRCQRGYFVESLGGAQFAVASTVDRLRSYLDRCRPGTARVPDGGARRRRSRQSRTAPPCRGPTAPTGRAARPVRWLPWSTGSWPGSSSAAAARCSASPTTRMPIMRRPGRWPIWSARAVFSPLLVEKINGVPVLEPGA